MLSSGALADAIAIRGTGAGAGYDGGATTITGGNTLAKADGLGRERGNFWRRVGWRKRVARGRDNQNPREHRQYFMHVLHLNVVTFLCCFEIRGYRFFEGLNARRGCGRVIARISVVPHLGRHGLG